MPGKQMSIDAELRAGHIDHNDIVPRLPIRMGARRSVLRRLDGATAIG
jgi:type III secretory pathway component EscV